jgi:hypothetical protein
MLASLDLIWLQIRAHPPRADQRATQRQRSAGRIYVDGILDIASATFAGRSVDPRSGCTQGSAASPGSGDRSRKTRDRGDLDDRQL